MRNILLTLAAAATIGAAAEDARVQTFYEGFEDYTEALGLNWIPEDWTEKNTPEAIPTAEQLRHNCNNSWFVYMSSNFYQDMTTDGLMEAFIHFGYDGDYGIVDADQDEWLITPAIKLASQETLHFIHQADASEVYDFDKFSYDTYTYSTRDIICNMHVMLTTDGGETWSSIWNFENAYTAGISDRQCYNESGLMLRNFDVDLSAYSGRTVQLAFRYWRTKGRHGNSMIVDGVTIDHPASGGIGDIAADSPEAPVEYFNLQGIRIAAPTSGMPCLRRTGTKVEKVIVH